MSLAVAKATPSFSALDTPTIEAGSALAIVSGTLKAGALVPAGTVAVTVGGVTVNAPIGADGRFTAAIPAGTLGAQNSPYPIAFSYAGSANFAGAAGSSSLRVIDTTAPAIGAITISPGDLGIPNHKLIDVTVAYAATDAGGAPVCTLSVSSNEPVNGGGDGHTSADWNVIDAHHLVLRAERAAGGAGRIYTVAIRCADAAGNAATAAATVRVGR
jgi:hypothetical protein